MTEIKKSIEHVISKAKDKIENYSTDIALQNTILSIPGGPEIDVLIREIGSKISGQRIAETIYAIQLELDILDAMKIDRDYVVTEEFYDLVIKIFYQSVKDRISEKKKLFAKILSNSILLENKNPRENSEDFINLLEDLSLNDLVLLKNMISQQQNMQKVYDRTGEIFNELQSVNKAGWTSLKDSCKLDEEQFRISLLKLNRSGFIEEISGTYSGYMGGTYIITPITTNLIRLIKEL